MFHRLSQMKDEFDFEVSVDETDSPTTPLEHFFIASELIRTMDAGFYKIRPMHAFSSQIAGTAVILGASLLGGPVSTTQVIGSTIIGAGAAERSKKVRWGVAGQILLAWVLTIPLTGLLGGMTFWILRPLL